MEAQERILLAEHEKRICGLEESDIRLFERLDGTMKSLNTLTTWVQCLIVAIALMMFSKYF